MIYANALIEKFQYALDNAWGYIYATAGVMWTAAKQEALEKTTDPNREMGRKYGKRWIGHYVADCSGLFSWAFKELGGYMYHGSDTMFRKYTTANGTLKSGKRTDGLELKPGTAVFVWKESEQKYSHVGLYIGNGKVIEAASTQKGVVKSNASDKKWTHWGELTGVTYGDAPVPEGYAVVTGKRVALRQDPSLKANIIMRIDTGKTVKIETPPPSEWEYVEYSGKKGYMMKKFLKEG